MREVLEGEDLIFEDFEIFTGFVENLDPHSLPEFPVEDPHDHDFRTHPLHCGNLECFLGQVLFSGGSALCQEEKNRAVLKAALLHQLFLFRWIHRLE